MSLHSSSSVRVISVESRASMVPRSHSRATTSEVRIAPMTVMIMVTTYTAVITEKDGTFYAKVPDVYGCITTASTLAEAIALITDALNLCLVGLEDEEITPNEPTPQSEIPHLPTDILTIIQADTIKYRSMTDTKAVRKNVSLPAWMSKLADKRGINCSKVLQEALTAKLL